MAEGNAIALREGIDTRLTKSLFQLCIVVVAGLSNLSLFQVTGSPPPKGVEQNLPGACEIPLYPQNAGDSELFDAAMSDTDSGAFELRVSWP